MPAAPGAAGDRRAAPRSTCRAWTRASTCAATRATPDDVVIVGHRRQDDQHAGPHRSRSAASSTRRSSATSRRPTRRSSPTTSSSRRRARASTADNALILAVRGAAPSVVLATTAVGPGGVTQHLRRRPRPRVQPRHPGLLDVSRRTPTASQRRMLVSQNGLKTFALAAAEKFSASEIADARRATAPGSTSRAARDVRAAQLHRRRGGRVRSRGRARQGRRRRRHGRRAAGHPRDLDDEPRADDRARDPRERDRHRARTASRCDSAPGWLDVLLVVVLGALAPLAATRAGCCSPCCSALRGDRRRCWSAPSSRSRTVDRHLRLRARRRRRRAAAHAAPSTRVTVAFERAQHARGVRALRPRVGGRPGPAQRRRPAPRRRAAARPRSCSATCAASRRSPRRSSHEQVIDALNRYLTEMSEAILDHGGTLVAYMGDGIMAVFGAPLAAGRPRRPRAGRRARHARAARGLQRAGCATPSCTTASRWASGSTAAP